MSIDRLTKAATAAGFAMATPDDDFDDRLFDAASEPAEVPEQRAVAVLPKADPRTPSAETVKSITTWVKGYLPGFGWRPA